LPGAWRPYKSAGYQIFGQYTLPADAWWAEYYTPLEQNIAILRQRDADNPNAIAILDAVSSEITPDEVAVQGATYHFNRIFCTLWRSCIGPERPGRPDLLK